MRVWFFVGVLTLPLFACPVLAQPLAQPTVADRFVAGRKPVQRGTVAAMGTKVVPVAGRGSTKLSELAADVFRDHDAFTSEARRGRTSLLTDPIVDDEVVELDHSTVLRRSTSVVVTDATRFRSASPTFARLRSGRARAIRIDQLDAKIRPGFERYRQSLAQAPAGHPLKAPAAQGGQQLLDAIAAGLGDFKTTVTVEVPKSELPRSANGKIARPSASVSGRFDAPAGAAQSPLLVHPFEKEQPTINESGTCEHTWQLLAGFTRGNDWSWSWGIDLGFGQFELSASAYYSYGLRIPMELTTLQTPNSIVTTNGPDVASQYDVSVTAKTLDAGKSFYTGVGLSEADAHDGKELVLEAGVSLSIFLKIAGVTLVDSTFPKNGDFDFGQDFTPPFSGCGTSCGFDVWIPSTITRSSISFVGVTGSARLGVKVTGDGTIDTDFEALAGGRAINSWAAGNKTGASPTQHLSFTSSAEKRKRIAEVAALALPGRSTNFGHRLKNTSYTWNVDLVPGIRGDIDIDWKIYRDSFPIGPFWLSTFKIDLGSFKLGPHDGTPTSVKAIHGEKRWDVKTPPKANVSPAGPTKP